MPHNYRKMFSVANPGRMLGSDGSLSPFTRSSPIPPPASGASVMRSSYTGAVSGVPAYNPQAAQANSTMMVGGIPSVFQSGFGDI